MGYAGRDDRYRSREGLFSAQKDTLNTIKTIANLGADGLVIWGSSEDANTEQRCADLRRYVTDVLGPTVKNFTAK